MRIFLAIPALCLLAGQLSMQAQKNQPPSPAANYGNLPLSFEVNQGQTDPQVRFLARGQGYSLFLTDSGAALALTQHQADPSKPDQRDALSSMKADVVRMELAGAATPGIRVDGTKQLPGVANYFIGRDSSKWHSNIPTYAQVKYSGVYPGVDLIYYGNQRQLEYDFIVAPGANPKPVQLHFAGAQKLKLSPEGDLIITAQNGEIAFHRPVAYQMKSGQRQPIDGRFTLLAKNNIGFSLGNYDHSRELVIDPALAYSTYLGGNGDTGINAVAVDTYGNAYLTGQTTATDFPVTGGVLQTAVGAGLFVTKLNAAGTALVYSTYFGGTSLPTDPAPEAYAIAVDQYGSAYVTGTTGSNFPVTPGAFQAASGYPAGQIVQTGYVMKLHSSGSALVYSTYLGGSGAGPYGPLNGDIISAIAVDGAGHAYVSGATPAHNFPVTASAFQKVNKAPTGEGQFNGFVSELNAEGTGLVYSTYLGGKADGGSPNGDWAQSIAVDNSGAAYVTGLAGSSNFPVTPGAYQSVNKTGDVGTCFVTKVSPGGATLAYSTYLGGSSRFGEGDRGYSIATDSAGDAFVTGFTGSLDFPVTSGAFQTENRQGGTAFVTKMNSTGAGLIYSTFLGPQSNGATAYAIAVDRAGQAVVTGATTSPDFEVTPDAFQSTNMGLSDPDFPDSTAFVTQFNSTGTALIYSTYFGGNGEGAFGSGDGGNSVAVDALGNAYIAGSTGSTNFPVTPGAFQNQNSAARVQGFSGFISKFALHGATTTGLTSSANPQGPSANVLFTAAVLPVGGTGTPTGVVEFRDNGSLLAQEPVPPSGIATYSTSSLPVGTNVIVAGYLGDTDNSSSSNTLTQTILADSAATPVISPAGGAFTSAFQVTITSSTVGSTIHYTLDGSTPTAASPTYTGPIQIAKTSVLNAITIEPGAPPSTVASASYTVDSFPGSIQFAPGTYFAQNPGSIVANGSAKVIPGAGLVLTNGGTNEAGSAFYGTPVNVKSFTTSFQFQLTNPVGEGFTFTIQNTGPQALGGRQAGLGYVGIHHSVAIKFDLFDNAGEGPNSTGIYTAGNLPTVPAFDLTPSGVNLHSTDPFNVTMTYDGTTLNITITDAYSGQTYSHAYTIDIPAAVAGTTAYVGFTGATGEATATQTIVYWDYSTSPKLPSYPNGFTATGMTLNGGAAISGSSLSMAKGYGVNQATSAFFSNKVSIAAFTTNFNFAIRLPGADGFTFTIQNTGPNAVGGSQAGLGYVGIHHSVAIKFDVLNNAGEGPNSTGIYTAGNIPTVPSIDLAGSGINLQSGHLMNAQINYDGVNLTLYLTDLATMATWSYAFPIDIPATVFGSSAYIGFTAGTGDLPAIPSILSWSYGLP